MRRLVIAAPLYPPELGGPATYVKILEDDLPAQGVEVRIIKFKDVRTYPPVVRHLLYAFRIARAGFDADAVYALDPVSTGLPAFLASLIARKPFYLRIAGDYAWEQGRQRFGVTDTLDEFVGTRNYPVIVRLLKALQTFVARRATAVVVPSEYLKGIIIRWGIREEKISVVYNAPSVVAAKETYMRPDVPGAYIVTVGRLVPWKGMDGVIHAFAEVRKGDQRLNLVIVGEGPERARLMRCARHLGLAEVVIFTGALSQEAVAGYLAHADAFVLNTQYEGLSHLILEAFALGTPVATTPVGGNVEVIEDGVTGVIFSYRDVAAIAAAITRVRSDASFAKTLTDQAQKRLERFTREGVSKGTLAVFAS